MRSRTCAEQGTHLSVTSILASLVCGCESDTHCPSGLPRHFRSLIQSWFVAAYLARQSVAGVDAFDVVWLRIRLYSDVLKYMKIPAINQVILILKPIFQPNWDKILFALYYIFSETIFTTAYMPSTMLDWVDKAYKTVIYSWNHGENGPGGTEPVTQHAPVLRRFVYSRHMHLK